MRRAFARVRPAFEDAMSWTLLIGLVLGLGLALFAAWSRRGELRRMQRGVLERERAVRAGSETAQLQHPVVDLTRCMGCGACVRACPEQGVLELVHGQAMVVNATRCTGVSACERECPVGAITVTLTNLETRRDVPAISEDLEAVGTPGLFLAGEVTAHALIKTAIEHGTAVADEVARRSPRRTTPLAALPTARASTVAVASVPSRGRVAELERPFEVALDGTVRVAGSGNEVVRHDDVLDLCVIGAGPAGLACSLQAKKNGLSFVTLDQESGPGGTVAKYPRRKLVLTQPVDLPLYGRLDRDSYSKEELMELWQRIARQEALPIRGGVTFQGLERDVDGTFVVNTNAGAFRARNVCLAMGRRGSPRKLDVPGEDLVKVSYHLVDAASYQGRRILVVGGGDSAVEAAVGLAEQPGNQVLVSYRKESFFRIRLRTEEKLKEALARGNLRLLMQSEVVAIRHDQVDVAIHDGPSVGVVSIPNDDVFVMIGGTPPVEVLERSGVSFDPALREPVAAVTEQGSGLVRALAVALGLAVATLGFAMWHADYYTLPIEARPVSEKFGQLRPSSGLGLWLGFGGAACVLVNLLYLLRRSGTIGAKFGSLRAWMTSHVATGILALLFATLHGGMAPRDTVGGHALWALAVLLVTGAIGRYFYAYVPRAANGRELQLEEAKLRLSRLSQSWDESHKAFVDRARATVARLVEARQWNGSFLGRVGALVGGQRDLRRALDELQVEGRRTGVPQERIHETLSLTREAYRTSLMTAHYEDLRALLNTWRYLHRWVAALMVVLLVLHVVYALAYGSIDVSGGTP